MRRSNTKTFDTLIQRNRDFAAHRFARTESFASTLNTVTKAYIIGCADPRVDPEGLKAKSAMDPRAAVALNVAAIKANPSFPGKWLVSGLVYDVATGLVETVVLPAPLRDTEKNA